MYFDSNGEPIWFIVGREPDFDKLVPTGKLDSSIPMSRYISVNLQQYTFPTLENPSIHLMEEDVPPDNYHPSISS